MLLFDGTSLTKEWLQGVLQTKFGQRPEIDSFGLISEASHGYMSQIRRVRLSWPSPSPSLPSSVVVKAPAVGSAADAWVAASGGGADAEKLRKAKEAMAKVQALCHSIEHFVYSLFQKGTPVSSPKIYATFGMEEENPAIVMEDISNAHTLDVVQGFSERQLYMLVDQLVNLHVYSFTNKEWKKGKYHEDDKDIAFSLLDTTSKFARNLIELNPEWKSLAALEKNVLSSSDWFFDYYDKYEEPDRLAVLAHGDLWAPQFLWRGEGEKETLAAIVDWQLCHSASVAEDILRLLVFGVDSAERKRLTRPLLQYYFSQLSLRLPDNKIAVPFTFDVLLEEYKSILPYVCGMTLFALGMWSNSPVLKDGIRDEERVAEMTDRARGVIDEVAEAYGW